MRRSFQVAVRRLLRSPGLALAVVLTLALGFGANITIFSLVDAVLFRPLPIPDADRLVRVMRLNPDAPEDNGTSYPAYLDYRDQSGAFTGLAAFTELGAANLGGGGTSSERVNVMLVTGNFFGLLGARPLHGALLSPSDDTAGAPPAVVISEALWRRRFGADPRIVGQSVQLNRKPFTVAGVVPRDFVGPSLEARPDLWAPVARVNEAKPNFAAFEPLNRRGFTWLQVVGRLQPGMTAEAAKARLDALVRRAAVEQQLPPDRPVILTQVVPAAAAAFDLDRRDEVTRMSWILLGVVVAVLLIACAVVSGLLLVRLERSQKETAVQVALGISRRRLFGDLLMESLLLSLLGALAGLGVASLARRLLLTLVPATAPIPTSLAAPLADLRVLGFTVLACLVVGLLFGLAPALRAVGIMPAMTLRGEGAGAGGSRRGLRVRNAFVVVQVALSTVLLIVAGLLLRTLAEANAISPGFRTDGTLTASMDLGLQGYDEPAGAHFIERLVDRLAGAPGVRSVAVAESVPVSPLMRLSFQLEGHTPKPGEELMADFNAVSPGYFSTMGIQLLRGRDFTSRDTATAPAVAIINETMAQRFWPGQDPIGRRLGDVAPDGAAIIGVVADIKAESLRDAGAPMFYMPIAQFYWPRLTVVVRTGSDSQATLPLLTRAVAELDPSLPLYNIQTLRDRLGVSLSRERAVALLFSSFGLLALILAVGGLYSVISHGTELRTREFGIRMAMGSDSWGVQRLVLGQGLMLAMAGLVLGLLAAYSLTSWLSSLLLEVSVTDPATFAAIPVLLMLATLLACLLPAYRATRVDPMLTLRQQ